jgi:hypothetical protein
MKHGDSAKTGSEVTVDEALRLMKPTALVTEEIKAALATQLIAVSDSPAEIAEMSPLLLASRLIGMNGTEEEELLGIARELAAAFRAMLEDGSARKPAKAPARPPAPSRQGIPRLPDEDYRAALRAVSLGRQTAMSGDIRLGPVVIDSFDTMSGSVTLEDTIVLGHSSTMSGSIHGTAYATGGTRIFTMSGGNNLVLRVVPYEELARRAGVLESARRKTAGR